MQIKKRKALVEIIDWHVFSEVLVLFKFEYQICQGLTLETPWTAWLLVLRLLKVERRGKGDKPSFLNP